MKPYQRERKRVFDRLMTELREEFPSHNKCRELYTELMRMEREVPSLFGYELMQEALAKMIDKGIML